MTDLSKVPSGWAGQPLVSVLMPSYNHARYIEHSIKSVLSQTYPNIELIIIDDASSDGTADIANSFAHIDNVSVHCNPSNIGVNETLLRALAHSRGAYIAMLASDDQIFPDKIAKQMAHIQAQGLDGIYASGIKLFDDGSTLPIDHDTIAAKFADGSILSHIYITDTDGPLMQSGLFSRRMWEELAPERGAFKSDDHMFLIRGLERYRIGFIAERLFFYRIHVNNTYRRYWFTFPHRIEIAALLTPEHLKTRYLSNILYSQAEYLFLDGYRMAGLKLFLASLMLWPSPRRFAKLACKAVRGVWKYRARREPGSL